MTNAQGVTNPATSNAIANRDAIPGHDTSFSGREEWQNKKYQKD